jgi:type IV pilus biogenesis protein CpaD/CtpE
MPSDDWPSFNAELTRKTSEQLQIWIDRYEQGVIKLSAIIAVVGALYDATSGMVERDLSDLLADVHRDLLREAQAKL